MTFVIRCGHWVATRAGGIRLVRRWAVVKSLLGAIITLTGFEIVRTWGRGLPTVEAPAAASHVSPEPALVVKGNRGGADKSGARVQDTQEAHVRAMADKNFFDPSRKAPRPEEISTDSVLVTKPPDNVIVVGVPVGKIGRPTGDATQSPVVTRRLRPGDQVAA